MDIPAMFILIISEFPEKLKSFTKPKINFRQHFPLNYCLPQVNDCIYGHQKISP